MYAGKVVEQGTVDAVFQTPQHPYTIALIGSIPRVDVDAERPELPAIRGLPPSPGELPSGCPFHPRCDYAEDVCSEVMPEERLVQLASGHEHRVSCHVEVGGGDAKAVVGETEALVGDAEERL
jgi:peptide/nickel transport system ATP-binding protein